MKYMNFFHVNIFYFKYNNSDNFEKYEGHMGAWGCRERDAKGQEYKRTKADGTQGC